jgi:tyrosine-specific transport protein
MVDFLADGMQVKGKRGILCLLVFFPPFLLSALDPSIFVTALGFAGGFGEAFLNGVLPVAFVWVGRYMRKLEGKSLVFGGQGMLSALFAIAVAVAMAEIVFVIRG